MNNRKTYGVIGAIVLAFTVIMTVSMVYAAFTETLTINGNATVSRQSWDIHFEDISSVTASSSATVTTAPTIASSDTTTINAYEVTLTNPGDSISFTVNVKNSGTFAAKLSTINIPTPTCTGLGETATVDAENVCSNLTYTVTYSDGSSLLTSDTLMAGDSKTLKITLTYSDSVTAEQLPTNDVKISNLGVSLQYTQA